MFAFCARNECASEYVETHQTCFPLHILRMCLLHFSNEELVVTSNEVLCRPEIINDPL